MARKQKKRKDLRPDRPSRLSRWWSGVDDVRQRAIRRSLTWMVVTLVLAGAAWAAMEMLERQILSHEAAFGPTSIRVSLADRPGWMPASLARQIEASLCKQQVEFYDRDLTRKVYSLARDNPWIHRVLRVTKRRTEDSKVAMVELWAEFRRPVAKILTDCGDCYVDAEAVRLPAHQVPLWVAAVAAAESPDSPRQVCYIDKSEIPPNVQAVGIHYIIIHGVTEPLPPAGRQWQSDALVEGLKLVQLIGTRSYANQITEVDVRNHDGQVPDEPRLRMWAQVGRSRATDIRFGRFPVTDGDYVVTPQRKMSYLDGYVADHDGRLAGLDRYLDLRYDELHFREY
ncbi:MAG: hypothetical protein SVT52_05185 [Planctomycetota bacterium]|nr:hypothetical protein [Planctomycetota bacterium]